MSAMQTSYSGNAPTLEEAFVLNMPFDGVCPPHLQSILIQARTNAGLSSGNNIATETGAEEVATGGF